MGPRSSGTPTRPAARGRALPTRPHTAAGTSLTHVPPEPTQPLERDARDIRRKRPPVLSFLLRISTARRLARVISLLALDFAGVALAIFTALLLKEALHGQVIASRVLHGTERFLP